MRPRQEIVRDGAEAVLVSGRSNQLAGQCLWRHVHQRSDKEPRSGEPLLGGERGLGGNAEIEEFYVFAPRIVHHIVRL